MNQLKNLPIKRTPQKIVKKNVFNFVFPINFSIQGIKKKFKKFLNISSFILNKKNFFTKTSTRLASFSRSPADIVSW